jgi:two-component system, NarL family, response regulator NreC
MKSIRLMLVDDHDVVRTGLKSFLGTQEGLEVVAEAGGGQEALGLAQELLPDVVIMDITMPEMDGLEATRRIKESCPECKVLALTVHADKQYFFEMLAAGAEGYVTKQVAAEELVEAIRAVAAGNVYLQPALATWLLEDYRRLRSTDGTLPDRGGDGEHPNERTNGHSDGLDTLSRRELQVIECVAQGMTNSLIGEALGISPKTVARHRERIMDKLDMHSSAELVRFAIRNGLIDI